MFKVWIHIEDYDEERQPDESIDQGLPEHYGVFDTLEGAQSAVNALMGRADPDWLAEGQQLTFGGG
jgi:hypothetical protein